MSPADAHAGIPPASYYDTDDSTNVCILCDSPRYTVHREVHQFGFPLRFNRCQCGLIKQTPMPNEQFFEWFFNSKLFLSAKESDKEHIWGFYDYIRDEKCRLATSRYRYWRLRRIFETGRRLRIMKIGPGTGSMLYIAQKHGHDATGSDISDTFVSFAHQHYGVQIDHGRFEHLQYEPESFDVILLFNVIENVPNLPEFIESIHSRLRPGGYFVLNHVDMAHNLVERFQKERYFLYRPPVCYIFSGSTLSRLLTKYGFTARSCLHDLRFMHFEKIFTLLGWYRALAFARHLKLERLQMPIPAYPSRIVVARRRTNDKSPQEPGQ